MSNALETIYVRLSVETLRLPTDFRSRTIDLVTGDRLPRLSFQFFTTDGVTPRDITGFVPVLRLRRRGEPGLVNAAAVAMVVDSAAIGTAHYDFTATDLLNPGDIDGEVGLTKVGEDQTVYDPIQFRVRRRF